MNAQDIVDFYNDYLRKEIFVSFTGDICGITVPYSLTNGDYIEVFVGKDGDRYVFSDDKAAVGSSVITSKTKRAIKKIVKQDGFSFKNDELTGYACSDDFAKRFHAFAMTIIKVDTILTVQSLIDDLSKE